jgi:hypothetical protein
MDPESPEGGCRAADGAGIGHFQMTSDMTI